MTIIASLYAGILVGQSLLFYFIDEIVKDKGLKKFLNFRKLYRFLLISEFVIFNFIFSFFKPVYVYQLILQIFGNIFALFYFFVDRFYLSEQTRSYLLWMQNKMFRETKLKDIFEFIDADSAKYVQTRKLENQAFSIVDAGKKIGLCIFVNDKNGGTLLKPFKKMDEETLMFYAQKLEIDYEEEKCLKFCEYNLSHEAIRQYDYGKESKIYIWIRDKLFSKKGKTILKIIGLGLILLLVILIIILNSIGRLDHFLSWFSKEL